MKVLFFSFLLLGQDAVGSVLPALLSLTQTHGPGRTGKENVRFVAQPVCALSTRCSMECLSVCPSELHRQLTVIGLFSFDTPETQSDCSVTRGGLGQR